MSRIAIAAGDYASFPDPAGSSTREMAVKQFVYSTPGDAQSALYEYNNEDAPVVEITLPSGERRDFTRGEILFAWHNHNCVAIILSRVTGAPLPWFPY